jgi:2-keto-4-pentenoate hydratase/2-oxohepta-3-ene-1,7-dioic acid hydratase in catechol pathway
LKLLRFEIEETPRLGVLWDDTAVDLEAGRIALQHDGDADWPGPLLEGFHDVFRLGGWTPDHLRRLTEALVARMDTDSSLTSGPGRIAFSLDEVRLLNPLPAHSRIFTCRGLNPNTTWTQYTYALPVYPTGDMATRNRLIGPHDPIVLDPFPPGLDASTWEPPGWNPELGIVIGKRGRRIPREQALDHIAGYTIYIDGADRGTALISHVQGFSCRDCLVFGTEPTYGPWCRDHPIGPWITTRDELDDASEIEFTLIDSGSVIDVGFGKTLIFGVDELVHFLSQIVTLEPGDLITTSAPGFDGLSYRPDYREIPDPYLRIRCPQLGDTINPIVDRRYDTPGGPTGPAEVDIFEREAPS